MRIKNLVVKPLTVYYISLQHLCWTIKEKLTIWPIESFVLMQHHEVFVLWLRIIVCFVKRTRRKKRQAAPLCIGHERNKYNECVIVVWHRRRPCQPSFYANLAGKWAALHVWHRHAALCIFRDICARYAIFNNSAARAAPKANARAARAPFRINRVCKKSAPTSKGLIRQNSITVPRS
jgi:hypothetical protein